MPKTEQTQAPASHRSSSRRMTEYDQAPLVRGHARPQEQLYGAAVADAAAEGVEQYAHTRWRRRAAAKLPGAVPIARAQRLDAARTAAVHLSDAGSPVIVTDAQDGWKARQLWSFGYLREHFGEEHVFCTDRVRRRVE